MTSLVASPILGSSFGEASLDPRVVVSSLVHARDGVAEEASEGKVTGEVEEEDVALMQAIGRGDAGAYRELVQRHLRGMHAFAYRMLSSRAEAEEVCQESFLRLWTSSKSFAGRAKPSTWLYRIAHNLAVDRLRRRREASDSALIEEAPDSGRASSYLQEKQLAEAVQRALGELPERQRAAISLVHYQGMSGAEAAEVLGVGLRALESLLARGRRQLREQLRAFHNEGNAK